MAEKGGVFDIVEEADLDGGVGELRESDGLHGVGRVRWLVLVEVVVESHRSECLDREGSRAELPDPVT